MADEEQKQEPSEEEKREERRQDQLKILNSEGLKAIYAASVANLGNQKIQGFPGFSDAKEATYRNYLEVLRKQLEEPDEAVSKFQATSTLEAEAKSQNAGETFGEASYSALGLFRSAQKFYESALASVKVSDVLELMPELKRYEDLSKEELDMYMGDFQKSNGEYFSAIFSCYLISTVQRGVGESQIDASKDMTSLETILNKKTDESNRQAEEEQEKKQRN